MTELHHFHPARKGSGSLCPFPIYPLYTRTVILSLDKPIADCFLFRPRRSCEKCRKRSHTNVSNTLVTWPSTPPAQTPQRSFQKAAAGYTRHPSPNRAHTGSHGETRGVSGGGRYYYPRSVLRGSETLRGQVSERRTLPLLCLGRGCSQRTQRAFGTAMRLCASLSQGVAAPLGCVIPLLFLSPHRWASRFCSAASLAHRKLSVCSLVTAVRFWDRCLRRSMRETYPLGQRSGCRF